MWLEEIESYYLDDPPHADDIDYTSWVCECCGAPLGEGDIIYTDNNNNVVGCENCRNEVDAAEYFESLKGE